MYKVIIFIFMSAGFILVSFSSLRNRRSHGFFRFFAFESLLALILLNLDHWFINPFSAMHIVSWVLLILSIILAIHGFWLLRVIGKPEGRIEETTALVTIGAYKYIRHPLYSSLLSLGLGALLKQPSPLGSGMMLVLYAALIVTARVEEKENLNKFGPEYDVYMKKSKMFIPSLF
jgi:protein-S-isoprenylcysteine O-methyltransferase Ste14